MFAALHIDGVDPDVARLAGDGGFVGTVARALGDETSAEVVPIAFGAVVTGVPRAAADGLVDRYTRECLSPRLPFFVTARSKGAWAAVRGTLTDGRRAR